MGREGGVAREAGLKLRQVSLTNRYLNLKGYRVWRVRVRVMVASPAGNGSGLRGCQCLPLRLQSLLHTLNLQPG